MNFSQDQIVAIIGSKEMELIFLRIENAQLKEQIAALMPPVVEPDKLS